MPVVSRNMDVGGRRATSASGGRQLGRAPRCTPTPLWRLDAHVRRPVSAKLAGLPPAPPPADRFFFLMFDLGKLSTVPAL